ncbi:MAG: S8 family serine peptidase [Porcipelethomonas sp.]
MKFKKIASAVFSAAVSLSMLANTAVCYGEGTIYQSTYTPDSIQYYYIFGLEGDPLACYPQAQEMGVHDFVLTDEGREAYEKIMQEHEAAKELIADTIGRTPEVKYDYTAAYNGFSAAVSYNEMRNIKNAADSMGVTNIEWGGSVATSAADSDSESESVNAADSNSGLSYEDLTNKIFEETGIDESGLDGEGTVIAVIDNEFDLKHEFFSVSEGIQGRLSEEDIKSVVPYLSASPYVSENCFVSDKIPFAFNYKDSTYQTLTSEYAKDCHGTHTAGISAGNGNTETNEKYDPRGVAPEAQLVLLSCNNFEEQGLMGAYDDALYLDADVINASYGATGATVYSMAASREAIGNITKTGTVFCAAAGNSAKRTDADSGFTDYSTGGMPDDIEGTLSVGAAQNMILRESGYITLSDGSTEYIADSSIMGLSDAYNGETLEYIYIGDLTDALHSDNEESEMPDLTDKLIVVNRYDYDKLPDEVIEVISESDYAGFLAYYDNTSYVTGDFCAKFADVPISTVSYNCFQRLLNSEDKKITIHKDEMMVFNQDPNMAWFSSWDFTEQLLLKPDITGFGGSIVSSVSDPDFTHKSYDVYSGTSMSAPQLTGINALLKQYLIDNSDKYGIAGRSDYTELSAKLLMSTAEPIYSSDSAAIASPRVQGNGLVNLTDAINTPCYLSSNSEKDNYRPKISLGDGYNQSYTLDFNITNVSDKDCTYTLSANMFKDDNDENGNLSWNTTELKLGDEYTAVFRDESGNTVETVTVPAGTTKNIKAELKLSSITFAGIKYQGGRFVDGFVRLSSEENPNLTLSYMAFCGDWSNVSTGGLAYDFWHEGEEETVYSAGFCDFEGRTAGFNVFDGTLSESCFSPNGDGVFDNMIIYMYFKRRCYDVTAAITNAKGQEVYTENLGSACSISNNSSSELTVNSFDINWDFKEDGQIKNGEQYTLTVSARLPLSDEQIVCGSSTFTVDTQAPVIKSVGTLDIGDSRYAIIEAEDNVQLQGAATVMGNKTEPTSTASANFSQSGNTMIVEISPRIDTNTIEVYDMAGNCTTISQNKSSYTVKAEISDWLGYATTDEESFNERGQIKLLDEKGEEVELEISSDITPLEAYEAAAESARLLIDGFETIEVSPMVGILGDANSDGVFNIRDAAYIANMLADKTSEKYEEFIESLGGYCADYNKDDTVNVRDAAEAAYTLASKKPA